MPKIYWAQLSDLPDIGHFVAQHFGRDSLQTHPGRLTWLGFEHPGGAHTCLASRLDKVVAICCHIPASVSIDQKIFGAAFGVDMMIDPAYRRQGIGQEILRQRQEKYELSLSTGQSQAMAGLYKQQNDACLLAKWQRALFVRHLNLNRRLKWSIRESLAYCGGRVKALVPGVRHPLTLAVACELLEKIPPRLASHEAGILVTPEHFVWRYGGPVYQDYSFFALRGEDELLGLIVTRQKGQTEYLSDLFCAPEARSACFRLAGETTPGTRIVAMHAGRPLSQALRAAGYFVQAGGSEIIAASTDKDLIQKLKGSQWCSFSGESDTDLIRTPHAQGQN